MLRRAGVRDRPRLRRRPGRRRPAGYRRRTRPEHGGGREQGHRVEDVPVTVVTERPRPATGGQQDRSVEVACGDLPAPLDGDAQPRQLGLPPRHEQREPLAPRQPRCPAQRPAQRVRPLGEPHAAAEQREGPRGLQAGRAPTDDEHLGRRTGTRAERAFPVRRGGRRAVDRCPVAASRSAGPAGIRRVGADRRAVAACCRDALQSRRPADRAEVAAVPIGRPAGERWVQRLVARAGLGVVGHDRVERSPDVEAAVRQSARPDPPGCAGPDVRDEVRVGHQRPCHLDENAPAVQRDLRRRRVHHAALPHQPGEGPPARRPPDRSRQVRRRGVRVGPRRAERQRAPADRHQVVDPRQVRQRVVGGEPAPRRQLVDAQPQAQHEVRPERGAHGGQDLPQQQVPVPPVPVVAAVGQRRPELPQQRVLPRLDLDAVQPGFRGARRRGGEPGHQRVDLVGPHLQRDLPRPRIRDGGGAPQRVPGVRGAPLRTSVAQRGDHERPGRPAGGRDGSPAGTAVSGERRALVGMVGRVHRRRLDDDNARAALGPPRVVGDVPLGEPAPVSEVRHVRPEQHARGGDPPAQAQLGANERHFRHIGPYESAVR